MQKIALCLKNYGFCAEKGRFLLLVRVGVKEKHRELLPLQRFLAHFLYEFHPTTHTIIAHATAERHI